MIRDFKKQDIDRIMALWLTTNISAHSFIELEYWQNNYASVKSMIPSATLYVSEENGTMEGFIGLMDNYIAGIFISKEFQSKGIGKHLLDYAKDQNDTLSLSVFKENTRAVAFYHREGFTVSKEQIDENTGAIEFIMHWIK